MKMKAERFYRLLLKMLPTSLRGGFQEEMVHDFLRRLSGSGGIAGSARVWLAAAGDVVVQAIAERTRRRPVESGTAGTQGQAGLVESLGKDLRYALGTLRRSPSFASVTILTLSLGIGGATVAFGLVQDILLRPLPFPADQELVVVREHATNGEEQSLSFPNFDDFRTQATRLSGIAALRFPSSSSVLGGSEPARGVTVSVSREFFTVLGVMPFIGRPILPEENRPGGDPVVVVSHEFWSRFLDSDEHLEGARLTVEGTSYAVVGVMPPGFRVLEDADLYLPLEQGAFRVRSSSNYRGVGRLAEGATLLQAAAELEGIVDGIREAYPEEVVLDGVVLRTLRDELLGGVSRSLFLLLGASCLLLLLACSNVASTLMARSVRREREMAIRSALGGGRARLVRLVFVEGLVLAVMAGIGGAGLTLATLSVLRSVGADFLPRMATVSVDGSVLGFALGAALLTSLLFGLLPALRLSRPAMSLRSGSRGNTRGSSRAGWNVLVGGQVALAILLLVASGLLLRSVRGILSTDTGFRTEGVLTVGLDLSAADVASATERANRLAELKAQLGSLPGVAAVGLVSYLPQRRTMMTGTVYRPPLPTDGLPDHHAGGVGWRVVDQGYFRAMGIPLLRGRVFGEEDGPATPPVVILNEPLERALFPGEEGVGSRVGFDPFWRDTELEVVGVVREAREWRVAEGEQPEGYVLFSQTPGYTRTMTAVIRTDRDPAALIPAARERVRALFPRVPGTFRTMDSLLEDSIRDREFTLGVLGTFALLSLLLSAVGIYGVVSYTVSAQAREIGIMLALGAPRGQVRSRIFARSLRGVLAGTATGLAAALLLGRFLEAFLFRVEPTDPTVLTSAPLVMLLSASLAILVPVLRHTRVDPVRAMQAE